MTESQDRRHFESVRAIVTCTTRVTWECTRFQPVGSAWIFHVHYYLIIIISSVTSINNSILIIIIIIIIIIVVIIIT